MELTQENLAHLKKITPGNMALYRLHNDIFISLYTSPSLPALNGLTREEYDAKVRQNATDIVLPEDLHILMAAVQNCLATGEPIDCSYRVYHKVLGFDWAHMSAKVCGELEGDPVFLAIYTNASIETDVYQRLLDHSENIVYVCDCETFEILYANQAARALHQTNQSPFCQHTCYNYIHGKNSPCANCFLNLPADAKMEKRKYYDEKQDAWKQSTGEYINWCGHKAFVRYTVDVSASEKKQLELQTVLDAAELQLQATRILNETSPIDQRLNLVLKKLGDYYQADRTYIFTTDVPDAQTVSNTFEWCREGVTPQITYLQKINIHTIEDWLVCFRQQQGIVIEDLESIRFSNPEEYAILKKQDIRCCIQAPIITEGKLTGFIGADNPSLNKMLHSSNLLLTFAYSIANATLKETNEKARREHAREMEALINNTPGGMAVMHEADNQIIVDYANDGYFRLHNSKLTAPSPQQGLTLLARVYPPDQNAIMEEYRRIAQTPEQQGNVSYRIADDRGGLHWINAQFRLAYIRNGIKYFYVSSVDMDPQKRAEEKIHLERMRLIALEGATFETFTFNITTNAQADLHTSDTKMMQLTLSEELLQQAELWAPAIGDPNCNSRQIMLHAANRIPESKDREVFLKACSGQSMRQAIKSGNIKSVIRYRRYIGEVIRWVSTSIEILPDPSTGDQIAFFYTKDITDSIIHERLVRQIIDLNYESLSWYDVQTGTLSSHRARDTKNYAYQNVPYQEVMRKTAQRFLVEQDRPAFLHKVSLENITSQLSFKPTYTFYYTRNERSSLPGNPFKRMRYDIFYLDEHKDIIIFLRNDVTEIFEQERETREKMAAAMHAAEAASQAKSDFLSRISHDIRTPINAITGMTAFAKEDIGDQEKVLGELAKIEASTKHLLSLINDVLDISKAESGKIELHPEPYFYEEYIKSIRSMFEPICNQHRQKFILAGKPLDAGIIVDRVRLDQITMNLISNAIKYTPAGGTISYTTESKPLPDGIIDCGFIVKDNGIGMSSQFQKTMFEPFTQEHNNPERANWISGTGLGLSIVKRLVDLMHGQITVKSAIGQGTEITVRFQASRATRLQLEQKQKSLEEAGKQIKTPLKLTGKILLVEDNALNTEIALRLLKNFGLEVETAVNGQVALSTFSASYLGEYQAILMDIQMPVLDGYETTSKIRALNRPDAKIIPIVAMTADVFADAVQKCMDVGMNAHLAKPINPQELYQVLFTILR